MYLIVSGGAATIESNFTHSLIRRLVSSQGHRTLATNPSTLSALGLVTAPRPVYIISTASGGDEINHEIRTRLSFDDVPD